ncbi:hypothetical protein BO85DRAFT_441003 [Aspergillus piperis CBS 112811]|uniref:Uncharacterized protein n=1 Tax=Aspergillus piperis CBS 112811 TaxID=1448313 RepID=A0A8G1QWE3_9EURO|nr:hypothetical protein BO85DRAFT_441003 [Aspergillus piperis CBS 112811]RAH55108.1 hypothetical protein BO85DRAFT_441003 [Aspergillus piperis CBS 112811]
MATVVVQQQTLRHSTPPPTGLTPALSLNRTSSPIPNKHIPVCPTGPSPINAHAPSPAAKDSSNEQTSSLLYPPDKSRRLTNSPTVYTIDLKTLSASLEHWAAQPLPNPESMFPWLHGLHPDNHLQLGFFTKGKRSLRRTPRCWRGITIVKVGGNLSSCRIKGAVAPEEVLAPSGVEFLAVDPREGFSVRNFQIQTAKLAPLSDIIVYGENSATQQQILDIARRMATAQHNWRIKNDPDRNFPAYNTFVLDCPFSEVEKRAPHLVAINSSGQLTGQVVDFFQWERLEMCEMSKASEISTNVWLGPTPDYLLRPGSCGPPPTENFDLLIEASELASIPGPRFLANLNKQLEEGPQKLEFPSSGSILLPSGETREIDDLVNTVRWIYYLANPDEPDQKADADGDIPMIPLTKTARKILIHCPDGYTESSLLAIAYLMFAEGISAPNAWLRLHCEKKRNFFAYPSDITFMSGVQARLLQESPATRSHKIRSLPDPAWFRYCDGSLPSRILPYMYLGNLSHANNPEMLSALGIKRILSIGETVTWNNDSAKADEKIILHITDVQDNGIDPLTRAFDRCLEFIQRMLIRTGHLGQGKQDGMATLVHCRVGVSRSATICIAEVMASLGLSFPRAYCFVRARRLNVIIQPHLRFVYELLKWEELQLQKRNKPARRELEWATVAREIALMNKPYSRQ